MWNHTKATPEPRLYTSFLIQALLKIASAENSCEKCGGTIKAFRRLLPFSISLPDIVRYTANSYSRLQ